MSWDLGPEGVALLGLIALGFGVGGGLLVGGGWTRRLWTAAITTLACFGVGLLTSEWVFGWATQEELQPNVDGLSRDEVLLSSLLTMVLVVVVMRYRGRHGAGRHQLGQHRGHPVGHA